jgi:hypothetical protein
MFGKIKRNISAALSLNLRNKSSLVGDSYCKSYPDSQINSEYIIPTTRKSRESEMVGAGRKNMK